MIFVLESLSTSQFNTLNESSISIGNLEAIQGLINSFDYFEKLKIHIFEKYSFFLKHIKIENDADFRIAY